MYQHLHGGHAPRSTCQSWLPATRSLQPPVPVPPWVAKKSENSSRSWSQKPASWMRLRGVWLILSVIILHRHDKACNFAAQKIWNKSPSVKPISSSCHITSVESYSSGCMGWHCCFMVRPWRWGTQGMVHISQIREVRPEGESWLESGYLGMEAQQFQWDSRGMVHF